MLLTRGGQTGGERRIGSLDALRGIAAMSVVLFHYTYGYDHVVGFAEPPPVMVLHGRMGVELFFIISGFVILRTLERSRGMADFALSRFARLYPAYFVCSCLALAVVFGLGFNPKEIGLRDVAASLAFASELTTSKQIDPSYWTLTYEIIFYGLAGFTYLVLGVRRIELACLVWLAIGVAEFSLLGLGRHKLAVLANGEWSYLFVLGMMIHLLVQGRGTALTAATVATCFAVCWWVGPAEPSDLSSWLTTCIIAGIALSVWMAASGRLALLAVRPLVILGDISYSLYLLHQIVGYKVIQTLLGAGVNVDLAILCAIVLVVGLAAVVRFGVELPAQRLIRDFGRRRLRIDEHVSRPSSLSDRAA